MSELFIRIVNMSISASWLVLAVLLLRLVLKKAPKWVSVLLWGFVAIRLICPISFESVLSLIPSAETVSPQVLTEAPSIATGIPMINSAINPIIQQLAVTVAPEKSINILQLLVLIFSKVWIAGFALMLIYAAVSYLLLRKKVATAVLLRNNVYQSENVDSPFVLGIIKPRIYLPFRMDDETLEYVIAHEGSHIRRKDHWWKPFGFVLLALHWFNPLMWLGYVLLCRDIELACDEKVIKEMDSEHKAGYTEALVSCSVNRRSIAACPLAFGEVGIKERVKSVMNYKKPAFWIIIGAMVTCVIVAVCFLTNPLSDTLQTIEDYQLSIPSEDNSVFVLEDNFYVFAGTIEKAQVQELYDLPISRKEISKDRSEDRDKTHTLMLTTLTSDTPPLSSYLPGIYFHFNADFTQVWVDDYVKPTLSYQVKNPEKAREIYERIAKNVITTDPSNMTTTRTMTVDDVIALTLKGMDPTWEDFQPFTCRDIGSGLFVMRYDINDDFYVLVGDGKLTGTPMYANLHCSYNDASVDIREGDVKAFIEQYSTPAPDASAEMIHGNLKTYYKNADGTWQLNGQRYQYRLVISGRMPNAAVDSTFVYLSNLKNITFGQAWKAAGLSSNMNDYFSVEEAVLVEWTNGDADTNTVDNTLVAKPDSKLDAAISDAVLSHHKREKPDGLLNTESHIILVNEAVSGTPLVGQANHIREVTVYVYYLNMRFNVQGDRPEEHDGIYGQAAITFTINENEKYTLKHFVKPESSADPGIDYSAELKNKFVSASEDIAENEEKYNKQLLDSCWETATDYTENRKAQSTAQPGGNPDL